MGDEVASMIALESSFNPPSSPSLESFSSSLSFLGIEGFNRVDGPCLGDIEILRFPVSDIGERERENDEEDERKRDLLVSISQYQTE